MRLPWNFVPQLRFQFIDVPLGQGLVLGGIGLDFGAVQRYLAQFYQFHGCAKLNTWTNKSSSSTKIFAILIKPARLYSL